MGLIFIFSIAAALAVLAKRKFEETVFPAIGLVAVTLMITGALGSIKAGCYLVILYLIGSIVILILRRTDLRKAVITPGLAAFVSLVLFFIVFSYKRFFITDVALSQYGIAARSLFETGSLKDNCAFYDLNWPLPFVSVWAYFVCFPQAKFSEWICIFSYDIFIISALLPLFGRIKSIKEETWQWCLMLLFCLCLPILKIPEAYSCYDMAVPQAVSMVYVYFMFWRLVSNKGSRATKLWYAGFIAYGLLMSSTLTQFGIYASIPLIMGICSRSVSDEKVRKILLLGMGSGCMISTLFGIFGHLSAGSASGSVFLIPGWCLVCVFLSMILTMLIRLYEKGYKATAMSGVLLIGVVTMFLAVVILWNSPNKEFLMDWFMEYTDKLFIGRKEEAEYIIGKRVIPIYDMTFMFVMMAVSGLASGCIMKKNPNRSLEIRAFNVSLVFGTLLYLIVLCILYINNIRQPHSASKPSIGVYIAPVVILAAVIVFIQSSGAWKKNMVILIGTGVLMACVFSDPVGAVFNKAEYEDPYPLIAACKDAELLEFTNTDRIFYIDKDLTDDLPSEFTWSVFPAGADSIDGLYFNPEPYKWVDYIKEPLSAEDFAGILRDGHYTYVYLRNVDDAFTDMYYPDFPDAGADIRSDALYRVEYTERGVQIIYIAGVTQQEDIGEVE